MQKLVQYHLINVCVPDPMALRRNKMDCVEITFSDVALSSFVLFRKEEEP